MLGVVCLLLQVFVLLVLARVVLSWFPLEPGGVGRQVYGALGLATEPVLGPLRRALPLARFGGVGLDLSPIIAIVGVMILQGLIGC